MEVLLALLVPAVVAGVVVALVASRWPRPVEAPAVPAETVAHEVEAHRTLRRVLQRRLDPSTLTGLALTVAVVVLVLGLLGVGVLLAMVESDAGFARWDLSFTRFGAEHAAPWTTTVLRDVSRFGGYELVLAMGLATAVYGVWRSRRAAVVGFLVLALGGQFLVANSVKWAVDRPRPDLLNLTGFAGSSFPSGHATAAAATLMAMALVVGRDRSPRVRAVLAGLAAGGAVAVAATRVLLGVHWFTDVVAGLLLGWAWFALCSIAFGGSLLRFGAPVAEGEAVAAEIEREGEGRTASDVDA